MIPNFKTYVNPDQSEEIQKLIFQLGGQWCNGVTTVDNVNEDEYLFFEDNELAREDKIFTDYYNAYELPEYTFEQLRETLMILLQSTDLTLIQSSDEEEVLVQIEQSIPDFKVRVNQSQNIAIQKIIMALGGRWINGDNDVEHILSNRCFLYYDEDGLGHGSLEEYFLNARLPEYTYDTLYNILSNKYNSNNQRGYNSNKDMGFEKLVLKKESSKELANVDNVINDLKRLMGYN